MGLIGYWIRLVPGDKDARLKMQECEKIVREAQFLEAIGQSDPPSAAEGLNLDIIGEIFLFFFPSI